MKTRQVRLASIIIAAALLGAFCSEAQADAAWYECRIIMTGSGFSKVYLMLEEAVEQGETPAFAQKWVWAGNDNTQSSRMLAIALTAINSGKTVLAKFDAAVSYPTLSAVYVIQ